VKVRLEKVDRDKRQIDFFLLREEGRPQKKVRSAAPRRKGAKSRKS